MALLTKPSITFVVLYEHNQAMCTADSLHSTQHDGLSPLSQAHCWFGFVPPPSSSYAHYNLGSLLHVKGQVDEALRHYKVVLRSDFNDADRGVVAYAHCNTGLVLEAKDRRGEAIRHYRYCKANGVGCMLASVLVVPQTSI